MSPLHQWHWPQSAGRRRLLGRGLGVTAGCLAGGPSVALARTAPVAPTDRIALVIGNAAYRDNPLPNPRQDAALVADLLQRAGFSVDHHGDLPRDGLLQALNRFGDQLRQSPVRLAVFYYAGHGFQQDWRNYLVPVDARVRTAADVSRQTVDVSELFRRMQGAPGRSHLVILDACRDDPFAGSYRPPARGLSQFDAPAGSLVAYATAPGQVAFDGPAGGHGLYTQHLVRELAEPDVAVEDALKRVRLNVRLASRGRQVPWEMGSLEERVYLFAPSGATARLSEAELEARFERELQAWNQVRQSRDVSQLALFIRSFPSGNTVELAQARLNRLLAEAWRTAEAERDAREQQAAIAALAPPPAAGPARPGLTGQGGPPVSLPPVSAAVEVPAVPLGLTRPAPGALPEPAPALLAAIARHPPLQLDRIAPTPFFSGQDEHRRRWSVGEVHEYRVTERGHERSRRTMRVTAVDEVADRVEFNDGEYTSDLMGNVTTNPRGRMSTPRQFYPAELVVGKRWRTEFKQARVSGWIYHFRYDVKVAAREQVTVPAGTFDTYRIEASGFNMGLSAYIRYIIWVAPGVNADIAYESFVKLADGTIEQNDRRELVALRRA